MPRIRSIKPEFWKDEKLPYKLAGSLGREARLLFIALWNFCEDQGVIRAHPAYLKGEVFPYDDDLGSADIARLLDLLEAGGFIVRYQREGQMYLWVRNFRKHQRIEKPSKPTLPAPSDEEVAREPPQVRAPPAFREPSRSPPGVVGEPSRRDMEMEVVSRSGGGDGGGTSAATFAPLEAPPAAQAALALDPTPKKPKPHEKLSDPRHGALKAAMLMAYREALKEPDWNFDGSDGQALNLLIGKYTDGEILKRWGMALESTHPTIRRVREFAARWGHFSKKPPPTRAGGARFVQAQDVNKAAFEKVGVANDF